MVRYNGLIKNLEYRISSLDGNPKFAKEVQGYREQILEYKRLRGNIKDNLAYNLDLNKRLNQSSFKPTGSDIQRLTSGEYGLAQHDLDLVLRLEKANIERQFYLDNFKGLDSLHEVETVINEIQQGKVLDLNDMINDAWIEHRKNFSLDDVSHRNIDIDFNLSSRERDIVKNDFLDMRYDAKSKDAFTDIVRRSKKGQTIDGKIGKLYEQYEAIDKLLGYKQKALKHARSELAKPIKEGLDDAATTTLLNQRARLRTMEVRLEKDLKELAERKSKLYKNIIDNISESKKLPTPQTVKDADEIANIVEELLHSKKKSFGQLTPIEREEIYTQAIELRNSKISTSHQQAYNKAIHASSRREKLRKSLDDFLEKRATAKSDATTPFSEVVKGRISESDELARKLPSNLDELSKNYDMLDDLLKRSDDLSAKLSVKTEVTREVVDEGVLQKIENVKRDLNSLDVRMANARETVLKDFDRSVNRLTVETANLDRQIQNLMYEGRNLKPIQIEDISRKIREYDRALSNNEAFINQMYLEFKQRNISAPLTRNEIDNLMAEYNPNLGKYVLDPDLDITDRARDIANRMRESFMEAGIWEVEINKLLEGQYDANFLDYLPHILTPEGELLFKNPDIVKTIQGFGDISGYGTEFNNFAKSRTLKIPDEFGGMIDNPTIEQINKFFAPFTGGKDVMSTNLHDIYLARATKHAELMYDHKYMEYMMDMFGKSYKIGDEVIEGHKVATNYGAMKSYMLDLTNRSVNMDIADDISRYLKSRETKDLIAEKFRKTILDPNNNLHGDEVKDNIIKELIDSFMAEKYTPEKLKILREKTLMRFTEETKTMGLLDELSKPLLDLSDEQLVLISNLEDSIKSRRMKIIDDQFAATLGLPAFKDNWHVKQFAGKNPSLDGGFNAFGLEEMRQTYQQLKQYSTNSIAKRIDRYVGHIDDMLSFESLKVGQIPEAVMTKTNHARELQIMKDNNDLLKMFDKFTHFIKVNQTSVMPSFHARNKMSNMFNNWLAIGADAYDIKLQSQIADAMKFRSGKAGIVDEAIEVVVDGKKTKMMLSEVLDMAESYGVIDKGIFAIDLGTELESSGLFKKFLPGKFDPTNMKDFGVYKKGTQIGSAIENHDRLIHFVSQIKRGVGFQEAAESVNKFLFDYSDLTIFEASVMKRIMPYYTWLRKNGALQLEMMLEQPEKYRYVSKVLGGVRGMVAPEDRINKAFVNDFALDWIQTPFMVTNPEGRQEPVLWNPNMPFMDLSRLPDLSDPVGYAKDLFTQTNPLLKVPIEIAMNKNVFFDSPLAKEGQSRIGKSIEHTANQMAVVPAVRGMVQKKGLDRALHTLNTTSGLKFLSYDYDKYKAMKIQEIIKSGNKKRPNIVGDVAKSIMNGFSDAISYAVAEVDNSFDAMAQNINAGRPSPDDYVGALRPISEATYNQLSDKEKARYTPPTKEDGAYYHNKAIELAERAYQETGVVKKFVWTLLDGTRLGSKPDDYKIAKVASVTDGDTFVADFGNRKENVRVLLVDAPETEKRDYQTGEITSPSMPFGDEAHEYGKEFLFGKDVKLYIDGSDKYGRLLAFVEVDNVDYAESLISEGLGVFRYDMGVNYPQKQTYLDTEMKAYESKKGLWNIEGYAQPNVDAEFSSNYNITEYDSYKKKKINELLRKKDAVRTNPSGWENVLNRLK